MTWSWQLENWPNFTWNKDKLEKYEHEFILRAGVIIGSYLHISNEDKQELFIQLLSSEAVDTSLIEGEHLNRDSVQSSIKKELGFAVDVKKSTPAERSIAMMMVDLYRKIDEPLTHETLCHWHKYGLKVFILLKMEMGVLVEVLQRKFCLRGIRKQ